jgi:hypothetical protein
MRWETKHRTTPEPGDIRFVTKFAFLPTRVLSKLTYTDHIIWLELYVAEQEYQMGFGYDGQTVEGWFTVGKTIHT